MTLRIHALAFAIIGYSGAVFAQPVNQGVVSGCYQNGAAIGTPLLTSSYATGTGCTSAFQINYFANLFAGDFSYIRATNDGSVVTAASVKDASDTTTNYKTGNICMNVYAFDAAEEMVSCCACRITPNGLVSVSIVQDVLSNTLTPFLPSSLTVKLVATTPIILGSNPINPTESCNPAFPYGLNSGSPTTVTGNTLPANLTTTQQNLAPSLHAWGTTVEAQPTGYGVTRVEFSNATLGLSSEIIRLSLFCGFVTSNGSGFGTCKSCRVGTQ